MRIASTFWPVLICILALVTPVDAVACTSAIVAARASASGRPLLWKHRDTGTEQNFVERVPAADGRYGYVALFNAGDSLLEEAWLGMNDAGFAIMNTASYNLAPDTAAIKDREGLIMTEALRVCATLGDFEKLLAALPRPLGVQANFGAIDAHGSGAYYETDDYGYRKYDVADAPDGILIRTNFSCLGKCGDGLGLVRYATAVQQLDEYGQGKRLVSPEIFTEQLSRRFDRAGSNPVNHDSIYNITEVEDVDFIPRRSTSASIVVEGAQSVECVNDMVMWTMPGYPPCSSVEAVTLDSVPDGLRPLLSGWRSCRWDDMVKIKHDVIREIDGKYYVDLKKIRSVDSLAKTLSNVAYWLTRNKIQK